ncbi:MAG: hypothetical protein ACYDGU_10780 [Acidiferrobacterales bacterium]
MTTVEQVDGTGEKPVAKARYNVVIITMGIAEITATDDKVIAFADLLQERRNNFRITIPVGAERKGSRNNKFTWSSITVPLPLAISMWATSDGAWQ